MHVEASIINEGSGLAIWVPAIVSIVTLIVNVFFYIFVQPTVSNKISAKNDLKKISISFLNYLAEVVSYSDFGGVPTEIRKYSLQIHLCFESGIAPSPIDNILEGLFQMAKKRKELNADDAEDMVKIAQWNTEFRNKEHELRIALAKYCGTLKG